MLNATIYTSDASLPFAEAMAVRNGRILGVGNYSTIQVSFALSSFLLLLCMPSFFSSVK